MVKASTHDSKRDGQRLGLGCLVVIALVWSCFWIVVNVNLALPGIQQPQLQGQRLLLALLLLPFDLVAIYLWWLAVAAIRDHLNPPAAGGIEHWDDGFVTRARLPPKTPLAKAATVALLAIPVSLVTAISFPRGRAPVPEALAAWGLVVGMSLIAYLRQRWRVARGIFDLVVDPAARRLALPKTSERRDAVVVPFDRIVSVSADVTEMQDSESSIFLHFVDLIFLDDAGSRQTERLVEWRFFGAWRAESFANWLQGQLKKAQK